MAAGVGGVTEKTLFLGPKIPKEVKSLKKLLPGLDKQTFRSLLKIAVADFEGRQIPVDAYPDLRSSSPDPDGLDVVFSGLHTLLRAALRLPTTVLKQETFKEDLEVLRIPGEFVEDLASIVFGPRRTNIDQKTIDGAPSYPTLESLRWRIDVSISTNVLSRALEPSILVEMDTSDGQSHSFEVQRAEFHKFRHAVATALKEMEELEKKVDKIPVQSLQ
uniref:COMM domain-containing protein 5 n=1 Tax=Ixodes ricinus TaxID=34613 RepID=A0A131XXF4_IXORI